MVIFVKKSVCLVIWGLFGNPGQHDFWCQNVISWGQKLNSISHFFYFTKLTF